MDQQQHQPVAPSGHMTHQDLVEMFPDLDLTATFQAFPHMTTEVLASWVIDNMHQIPRKKQELKQRVNANADSVPDDDSFGGSLLKKMLYELTSVLKKEMVEGHDLSHLKQNVIYRFLLSHFHWIRVDVAKKLVAHFKGRVVASAIACFLNQNRIDPAIQREATGLTQWGLWKTLMTKRERHYHQLKEGELTDEMKMEWERYLSLLDSFKKKYPSLFKQNEARHGDGGGELSAEAAGVSIDEEDGGAHDEAIEEDLEGAEKLECLVCMDEFPIRAMVSCIPPVFQLNGSNTPKPSDLICVVGELLVDVPTTSSACVPASIPPAEEDLAVHSFCRTCVRGQAKASATEMPLAKGGIGLRCMATDCKNTLSYAEVCHLLGHAVKRKLDERIVEENLCLASLPGLERCKACNFAMVVEVSAEVNKVFECFECGAKFCRLCQNDWNDEHFGRSCDEAAKNDPESKKRELEKKLNEAVVRKCPACNVMFMKSDGCNKMTCRCGMTMCYLCRQTRIDYSHFCQHYRDPTKKDFKCNQCNKKCLLHENADPKDTKILEDIKQAAAKEGTKLDETTLPGPSKRGNTTQQRIALMQGVVAAAMANLQHHQDQLQQFGYANFAPYYPPLHQAPPPFQPHFPQPPQQFQQPQAVNNVPQPFLFPPPPPHPEFLLPQWPLAGQGHAPQVPPFIQPPNQGLAADLHRDLRNIPQAIQQQMQQHNAGGNWPGR